MTNVKLNTCINNINACINVMIKNTDALYCTGEAKGMNMALHINEIINVKQYDYIKKCINNEELINIEKLYSFNEMEK